MSEDVRTQQRWLIVGVATLAIFFVLVVVELIQSAQRRGGDAHIGHRSPAAQLAYCGPQDPKLCVVSFDRVEGGAMTVNLQVPSLFYPEFMLIISRLGTESSYECKEPEGVSMSVLCSGPSQVPGETLQFKVISKKGNRLLAEGKFQIIGISISTPQDFLTPTGTPTATPTATASPTGIPPTQRSSTPTPPTSYPNPSYP